MNQLAFTDYAEARRFAEESQDKGLICCIVDCGGWVIVQLWERAA